MSGTVRTFCKQWRVVFCWLLFAAGLALQLFGPRLEVSKGVFVIPPALTAQNEELNPEKLIQRERRVQWTSAFLTLGGAIGLAFFYRGILLKRATGKGASNPEAGLAKF